MRASKPAGAVAWRPDAATRERAQLTRFLSFCGLDSFEKLYQRSIEDVGWFTEQVLRFLEVHFEPAYTSIVDVSQGIEWTRWCRDGGLNISTACLDRHVAGPAAEWPAVVWEGEEGATRTLTYSELHREVETCAAGLRSLGLGRGDTVGIHLPMMPETVVALLGAARMGAVAVPLFSGFGPTAIESRLRDVGAKALITCDAFPRRGVPVPAKATADEALERCPKIRSVIVVRRTGAPVAMRPGRDIGWDCLRAAGQSARDESRQAEPTLAEDPLIVLYTSGTTGRPKGIVHSHCGFPIKAAQDMVFGTDVGPPDRIAWITDLGWMMGPWLIYGATILGATMVLYDGAPDFPSPDRLWTLSEQRQVSILGISPTLVRTLLPYGEQIPARHDLTRLRIVGTTGEPWNPGPWWWLFDKVLGGRVPLINYSGGTEISGGILMGNPLLDIKPCSFPAPCPGIAADVVDAQGHPVRDSVGELVIRRPWIGMARGFWGDPERYLQTYWSRWPGVWVHGDWARVDPDGHWYILGRSDDTIKVAGKRVGPAEVESLLVGHPAVSEAAVVGVPDEVKGQAMVAFCVLKTGFPGTSRLARELRARVGDRLGKPLRPDRVFFVRSLPRTRNAKVMRRVIRAAYLGEDPGDISALENPSAVEAVRRAAKPAPPGD